MLGYIKASSLDVKLDEELRKTLGEAVLTIDNKGYLQLDQKLVHHLVLRPADGLEIDHINKNKFDNRRENLREVTHHENMVNPAASRRSNKFPKGVYQCGSGRFVATIMWKGKRTHLGTFDTVEEASIVFEQERTKRVKETYGY